MVFIFTQAGIVRTAALFFAPLFQAKRGNIWLISSVDLVDKRLQTVVRGNFPPPADEHQAVAQRVPGSILAVGEQQMLLTWQNIGLVSSPRSAVLVLLAWRRAVVAHGNVLRKPRLKHGQDGVPSARSMGLPV